MTTETLHTSQQVVATASASDGSTPSDTNWLVGDVNIATVTFSGLSATLVAVAPGATTLTVSGTGYVSDVAQITVTADLVLTIAFGTPTPKPTA